MSASFKLTAETRTDMGKGASRRLRRTHQVPAILYGDHKESVSLMVAENRLNRLLQEEAFYSSVVSLEVDGKPESVVLKDIQRHPARPVALHLDFQRVSATEKLRMHIPLHFIGAEESPGVKQGGVVTHSVIEIEVSCLAVDLPEYIEVDVSGLDVGDSVHASDINMPAGVERVEVSHGATHDLPIATMQAKHTDEEDEEETEAPIVADGDAE